MMSGSAPHVRRSSTGWLTLTHSEHFPNPFTQFFEPGDVLSPEHIITMVGERFISRQQDASRDSLASKLAVVVHDITKMRVDAIISPAHENLIYVGPSQLIGSVQQAGGPDLVNACRRLGRCSKGDAVATPGFKLPSTSVIHVVGPDHSEPFDEQKRILASCYRRAFLVAVQNGSRTIAIPDLSSLRAEITREEAARIATDEALLFIRNQSGAAVDLIVFCLLKRKLFDAYCRSLTERLHLHRHLTALVPREDDDLTESLLSTPAGTSSTSAVASQQEEWGGGSTSSYRTPWFCCRCRARPLVTSRCLVCYHDQCSTCSEGSPMRKLSLPPCLWLCELWTPNMKMLSRQQWTKKRDTTAADANQAPLRIPHERLSIDTLKYYDIPFHLTDDEVSPFRRPSATYERAIN